ncbi:tripartite motif-containing protein 5 [Oryctolagus cuniculus]|uniref:TRIM5 n=2 Tax=Oryctolagus cuniculus TaxID=9986 RepID=A7YM64_RABIT|nr:tripartite motif-containing protein 5 [Oryctolagus cuniculus]XP_008256810.1 tripartite motif-containing protein 5 isoform X1 [Oryctolagus cuniculus]XP_051700307.1 tripartite motif-containing protein 5 isoform X1 [Oryctolagus cuniculus]ABU93816.1 TRIM5 [Oryctolagus cuniculus]ACK77571.1 tripartite motif-containing 5 (predicted) [Oryctolagus cuniculus]
MASAILANMKEEVTCPICLELLVEPLSIDCGHSFCQACITANYESMIAKEMESRCPVCRIGYQLENLRPNRHVANIVEKINEIKLSSEEGQKQEHCARHGEKLLLFCKEDGKVICWLCERSQEHRGHHTFLMEEVAQEYQEKLQSALNNLMTKQEEAEKLKAGIQQEITSWKNQLQKERQNIQAEFKHLKDILDSEEQDELQKLEEEKGHILKSMEESKHELIQQSQVIQNHISDLENCLQRPTIEMLQDVNDIIYRTETFTLKKPKTFPEKERKSFQIHELKRTMQMFQDLRHAQRYWVHVTLTPSNNQNIVVSENKRQVMYVHYHQRLNLFSLSDDHGFRYGTRQNYFDGILGCPSITSGKHYWEVDVSGKSAWILGVYGPPLLQTTTSFAYEQVSKYRPINGYWVIGLQIQYISFEENAISLTPIVPPSRIGVFIDYEAGIVSFFSVTQHKFLIYKFSACSFSKEVFPYFNPMHCPKPMTICELSC